MKTLLIFLIVFCFGLVGFLYKQNLKKEYEFYVFLKSYIVFLNASISLFKNNLIEINDNFIIMQKNKNAKYYNMFLKNNCNSQILSKNFENILSKNEDGVLIKQFFETLGNNEYDFEKERIKEFEKHLTIKQKEMEENVKRKGELTFKIMLAVGALVAILVW